MNVPIARLRTFLRVKVLPHVPNALTFTRMFILFPIFVFTVTSAGDAFLGWPRYLVSGGLFLLGGITDWLDGKIARAFHVTSSAGSLFDTAVDKIFILGTLMALIENHLAPAWAVLLIAIREIGVMSLKAAAAIEHGILISASKEGKFKMLIQFFATLLLILSLSPRGGPPELQNFGHPFPAVQFWAVPELKAATYHLLGPGRMTLNDWQVLLYTLGRLGLWISVYLAFRSGWQYVRLYKEKLREKRLTEHTSHVLG